MQQITHSFRAPSWLNALVTTAIFFLFTAAANTTTYTVSSLNDSGPGTLRDAIGLATSPGDLINFSVVGTITLVSTLPAITNTNLTIDGEHNITISGNNLVQIMIVNSGARLTLENMTIFEGNNSGGNGGGILNSGTLIVNTCLFEINTADNGGGIYNNGIMTITNSSFFGNTANTNGGALYNSTSGTATIIDGSYFLNAASLGGGFYNDGTMNLNNSTLFQNIANSGGDGGGIFNDNNGTMRIANSTIFRNFVSNGDGAGIATRGALTITNSTIFGNFIVNTGAGGGIATAGGVLSMTNATIAGNSATSGGGLSNGGGTINLQNTILAGSNDECSGPVNAGLDSMADDNTCGGARQVAPGSLNLGPLQNYGGPTLTMALGPGSVAIQAGNISYAQAAGLIYDQRGPGFSRYNNGTVDVGAFEVQTPRLLKSFSPAIISTNSTSTLTITLNFASGATLNSFTDIMPSGLSIEGNASSDCGPGVTITTDNMTNKISASGTFPSDSGTCSITATVRSSIPGIFDNTIPPGNLVVNESPTTQAVSALLFVRSSCFWGDNC